MSRDLWLPTNHVIYENKVLSKQLYFGSDWQIYSLKDGGSALLMTTELSEKYSTTALLENNLLKAISFGDHQYVALFCEKDFELYPVASNKSPESKVEALSFALSFKATRSIISEHSIHDGIYVEQYSRILPTYTISPSKNDELVLGTWLTGGVEISTASFRRITDLLGWLPASDVSEIISKAGLKAPKSTSLLDKGNGLRSKEVNVDKAKDTTELFSLPGRPYLEKFFNEHVVDIIFHHEKYAALGIDFPSAIILHGPPGCGKTFAVEKLIEFIDWPSFSINSNSIGSPYIHETSKKISELFDKAIDSAPSALIIDEMESFLSDRRSGSSSGQHHVEEVAEFLRRIPEAINNRVLIIAMTNMIEVIDPAILRRGRFDHIIEVTMPSSEEVASLLESLLDKLPVDEDVNIEYLVRALTGRALSDSAFVIREGARLAARKDLPTINQECLEEALNSLPKESNETSRPIGFIRN